MSIENPPVTKRLVRMTSRRVENSGWMYVGRYRGSQLSDAEWRVRTFCAPDVDFFVHVFASAVWLLVAGTSESPDVAGVDLCTEQWKISLSRVLAEEAKGAGPIRQTSVWLLESIYASCSVL